MLGSSGGKTESSLYLCSDRALPGDEIGTASDLNARVFSAVEEGVEVGKDERVERGGFSGERSARAGKEGRDLLRAEEPLVGGKTVGEGGDGLGIACLNGRQIDVGTKGGKGRGEAGGGGRRGIEGGV